MPTYEPSGRVLIGTVPWDSSYSHVRLYNSKSEQYSHISNMCNRTFKQGTYTYIRMNSVLRVDANAETLYNCNYCMYQNANYSDKWFYAFIDSVEYINDDCTALHLSIDSMQTYMFDITLKKCYVEREHVNDDTPGKNLNPEPEFPFLTGIDRVNREWEFQDYYVVVETTAMPYSSDPAAVINEEYANGMIPFAGGYYNKMYSGSLKFGFRPSDKIIQGDGSNYAVSVFLQTMAACGGGEAVVDMYCFPAYFAPQREPILGNDLSHIYFFSKFGFKLNKPDDDSSTPVYKPYIWPKPETTHGNRVPRNKKLLTFPYSFFQIDDNTGNETVYRWELWNGVIKDVDIEGQGKVSKVCSEMEMTIPFDPSVTAMIIPINYNGMERATKAMATYKLRVQNSWAYSAYLDFLAKNGLALEVAMERASFDERVGFVKTGINHARNVLDSGRQILDGPKAAVMGVAELPVTFFETGANYGQAMTERDFAEADVGVQYNRAMHTAPISKGSEANAAKMNTLTNGLNYCYISLREEFAEILDGFFDTYGYAIDRLKVPNIKGRPNWNYVKTQMAAHDIDAPESDVRTINAVFDRGVTFWHTDDIANYALDNSIGGTWIAEEGA